VNWTSRLGDRAPEVVALADSALLTDGVAPLSGHVLDALDRGADDYLVLPARGAVAGVAVVHESDPAEIVVHPDHRRAGLGRELLTAALDRTGAVWAHGDLPPARALAAAFGLVRTRELLQMRRPLDTSWAAAQLAAAPPPPGVRIRTLVPGQDEQQFLGVNARAFDWHPEQGRLDLPGLELEMAQPWFDPAGFFLAVDSDDTVLGFHWTKVHSPDITAADAPATEALGEVYVLTAVGLQHLAGRGLSTVLLYVEGDNEPALRLYRRLGFTTYSTDVVYRR
jgi:mycothiol synthase